MSLLTLSTITGYARTSSSLPAIGTATTLGFRLRVNGAELLDGNASTGSQKLTIGAASGGTRFQVVYQHAGGTVNVILTGPGVTNPAPVIASTAAGNISSGAQYVIRGVVGPGGCSIALYAAGNPSTPIASGSAAGVTTSNPAAGNGYVKIGTQGGLPTPRGVTDGIDIWSQAPPAHNDAALPDASGLLWATYDGHGNIVWGATDLDDLNDASWSAGGAWDAPAPVVPSIDPDEGSESGGTAVTISGQYFRAGATVEIGGNAATGVTVEDDSEITCTTPAGSEGAADVTVENPDGQSDTLENGFTYTSDAEPLAAGTVTLGTVNPFVVCATATAASGGTPPYSYQWQRSPRDAGTWGNLSGQTSLTLRDRTVTPGTQYDYRLLVTDDEEETAASNVIQPNVPAAYTSWGVLGDSNSDEYRGSDARGGGTEWEDVTLNWTELLASPNGAAPVPTHRRDLDMGAWGSHGEPRRTGYAQVWARSGAEMSDVIDDQLAGLVAQIEAGTVTHVILQSTVNEWTVAGITPIYNSPDGGVTDSNGVPVASRVGNYVAQVEQVIDALVEAGAAGVVVITPPHYLGYPNAPASFPDATRRGYAGAAIAAIHDAISNYVASVASAEGPGVIGVVWWDDTLAADVFPTLSGSNVTIAGRAIDINVPPDAANPEYLWVQGPAPTSVHASTLVCGIVANDIIAAANQLVGVSIQPFSDAEILENAGIEAEAEVAPADVSHGHTVESPTLTQGYVITPDNVSHGHTAASPALSQAHQVAPANVAHAHAAASPGLSQALNLAAADVSHEHTAASPSLTQAHQVEPANVSHTHTAAAPGLTQAHVIEPADASHAHMAGSPHLTPAGTLAVQDVTHAHTAGSPALTQASRLEPDDVAHGHSAGSPTITQAFVVAPLSVDHAHTAGSPGLVVEGMVVPADVFHAHPVASPGLTQAHVLVPDDVEHPHTAGTTIVVDSAYRAMLKATPPARSFTLSPGGRSFTLIPVRRS